MSPQYHKYTPPQQPPSKILNKSLQPRKVTFTRQLKSSVRPYDKYVPYNQRRHSNNF